MFDHVTIRASDRRASERFYDTVLATIGVAKTASGPEYAEWGDFSIAQAASERAATRRLHIGFGASLDLVDAFWRTGIEAGYRDDGAPGPRPEYGAEYYGGFLLDPDGNSAEAAYHGTREGGAVDHLWIRVPDVATSKRFYETIAPHAGFRLRTDTPERAQFTSGNGSFSVVAGEPSEHVHMAFPSADRETIDAFHAVATSAGYADNGAPGERPEYHAGYYGAFVLDPDGNNVEVVFHDRR